MAAGGVDLVAAGVAGVSDDGVVAEDLDELFKSLGGGTLIVDAAEGGADGVVGDDVDVGAEPFHQAGQLSRVIGGIVDLVQQAIFDVDESAGALLVAFGGGHDFIDAISAVHGDQTGAGGVIGGVQREGKLNLVAAGGQGVDAGDDADGGDGDPTCAKVAH